ncbi:MAG: hypothetical protein JWM80_3528 [Cyanobacteria bacterium RYN_339]|nr:hypothetical protein [Cyanobacteria bacterium RYN_339]
MFSSFGGPKRFFTRTAFIAVVGMLTTIGMVWLGQMYGHWYGDGRVLGAGEGFWSFAYAWGTVLTVLYGLWAFNFRTIVRPIGMALFGYGFMGLLGMLGMRFGLPGFLVYWAGAGAATAYAEPFFRGYQRPARMSDRFTGEIRNRAMWVREALDAARGGMPTQLQDFIARQLMATLMQPIWKECTLKLPSNDALQDLRELPLLTRQLVGAMDKERDQAIFRAVFKALLADWNAIHQG